MHPFIVQFRIQSYALFCSMLFLVMCSTSASAACDKKFSLGWEPWSPYQYLDSAQQLTGLDIELVSSIIKNMGCGIEYQEAPWKRHLKEVEEGRIDLAAGASKTPEREAFAHFSDAYRNEFIALYVRKGEEKKYQIKNLQDIFKVPDFILGVTRGYFYGDEFDKFLQDPKLKNHIDQVKNDENNYEKIVRNRIHGFLADPFTAQDTLKQKKLTDKIVRHSMPLVLTGDIHVMLSKKSVKAEMVTQFNQSLSQLKSSGAYQKIVDKYLKD